MPSGRTHDRITFLTLPLVGILTYTISEKLNITVLISLFYLFSGLMFGPDLDIYSVQYKRWGLLRFIWNPYQKWIPHRSFLSHGLIIGTVIRIVYCLTAILIFLVPIVILSLFIDEITLNWYLLGQKGLQLITTQYLPEAIAVGIGLELGAMSHSLSDYIGSAIKRRSSSHSSPRKTPKRRKTQKKHQR